MPVGCGCELSEAADDEPGGESWASIVVTSFLDETRESRFLTAPDLERLCLQEKKKNS